MTQFIEQVDKETALAIHSAAIARFGGLDGVRDDGLLESALAQPFQTFGGEELAILNAERANQLRNRSFAAKTGRFLASFVLLSIFLVAVFLLFHNYRIMPHSGVHKRNVIEVVVFLAMFVVFIAIGHIIQERLDNGAASPEMVPILMFIQLTALASTWEIAISFGMIAAFIMTLSGPCTIDTFVTFAGSGAAVALASKNVRSRTQLFGVAFATAVTAFVLSLVSGYVVNDHSRVLQEAGERGLWGFLAGFLTAGVLPIFERCCGILTPMGAQPPRARNLQPLDSDCGACRTGRRGDRRAFGPCARRRVLSRRRQDAAAGELYRESARL